MSGQEKGYKTTTLIDFETSFNIVAEAGDRKGWRVPIKSNSVKGDQKLIPDDGTITGRRDPVEPDLGNLDASGTLVVPVDAHNFGLHLRAMFGLPTTAAVAAKTLDSGPAVNKGGGKVGLPCTAHGLRKGSPVVIAGTTNYNGAYTLDAATSADELVIAHAFTAETFGTGKTATLARRVVLSGAAVDKGSGKVGLPCAGHGLMPGARITVAGSTNYNATYTLLRGTSANELVVTATYAAETFTTATATAPFYDHTYTLGDTMPSFVNDRAFPSIPAYYLVRGLKVSKLSLSLGGEGGITASIDCMGAGEDPGTSAYVASPVELPVRKFSQSDLSLTEGGSAYTERVKTLSLDLDMGLDGDTYTINEPDRAGQRGDINESGISISGKLTALFKDADLVNKAVTFATSSLAVLASKNGYELQLSIPELKYGRETPTIEGPKGVVENHSISGFYGSGAEDSAIVVRLRNEIYTWEH